MNAGSPRRSLRRSTRVMSAGRLRIRSMAARSSIVIVLVALAWLGAASVASANYFGEAWFQPGHQLYGGYVRMYSSLLALGDYTKDALDDDFWAYNASTIVHPPEVFIESGIVVGSFCATDSCSPPAGPYRVPRYFWGDSRCCGGGLHEHVDVTNSDYPPPEGTNSDAPAVLGTYHDDDIRQIGTDTWYVHSGPWEGTSNSNPMNNDLLITGTEDTTQNEAYACNGQSGIGYYASLDDARNKNLTPDWPGANDPYNGEFGGTYFVPGRPPWVAFIDPGHFHDWAGPGSKSSEETACYGSATSASVRERAHRRSLSTAIRKLPLRRAGRRVTSSRRAWAPTLSESQIQAIALSFAAGFGDATPTSIEYAEGPRNEAVLLDAQDVVPDARDAFLIVIQGSFVDDNALQPPGASASITGSVLTLVVDAQTGQLTDLGIEDNAPELSSLGPVTVIH